MDVQDRQERRDRRYLLECLVTAAASPDPSTKLGALLVTTAGHMILGFNSFADGMEATPERLANRTFKLQHIVHAEMSVILSCARRGFPTQDSTLYFAAKDAVSGEVWGGAPCIDCAIGIISAGVRRVVSPPPDKMPERWRESTRLGREALVEAGVKLAFVDLIGC